MEHNLQLQELEDKMETIACWHHGDEKRLLENHLPLSRIDLYGKGEVTEGGKSRLELWWYHRMHLKVGDRIQIVVKGMVVATATIASLPVDFPLGLCPWQSVVYLKDIMPISPLVVAKCAYLQGSHRFDGPKTALLRTTLPA